VKVLLYRVDDRLIHGQVVLGWGRRLTPDRLLIVDDRIAADKWERELLAAAAPPDVTAEFLTVSEAARLLRRADRDGSVFVLMESPNGAFRLAEEGFVIPELNLGGLHREGGFPVTPYLSLLPEDLAVLRGLAARGTAIYVQDVPDGKRIEAEAFLETRP
jgi:mannose/fructose/N-acetylgalactosamine-specific phosphotransferase system component IIB